MKITIKRSDDVIELVQAMASKDLSVAYEARESFANLIGPMLAEVINNAPTVSNLFSNFEYNSEDNPSIPLDLYADITDTDYLRVWQQQVPGGLATNEVHPSTQELKLKTYSIEHAISFDKRHAAKSRLDVVGKSMARLAQEVLNDMEKTSANQIMGALAAASTKGRAHVQRATTSGRFIPEDFVTLDTLLKRIHSSWLDGTPVGGRRGITDLLVSPEIIAEIRRMAYNPINTKASPAGGSPSDGFLAPDSFRNQVWGAGGLQEFWGVNLIEILELGVGARFNSVFAALAGGTVYSSPDGSVSGAFNPSDDQILVGIDLSTESLIRPIAVDSDVDSSFVMRVDDQFPARAKKIGFFAEMEEGRVIIDDRVLVGKIVSGVKA